MLCGGFAGARSFQSPRLASLYKRAGVALEARTKSMYGPVADTCMDKPQVMYGPGASPCMEFAQVMYGPGAIPCIEFAQVNIWMPSLPRKQLSLPLSPLSAMVSERTTSALNPTSSSLRLRIAELVDASIVVIESRSTCRSVFCVLIMSSTDAISANLWGQAPE